MGRADVDVANRGVDVGSRPRRPCYPRGNFSVMPGPHQGGHERSLGHGFPAEPLAVKGSVKPAFALALYGGVLTRLSRPLGARVIFLRACRPSRTAHPTLSPSTREGLGSQAGVGGVSLPPLGPPERAFHRLPPTLRTPTQEPAPGCGKAPRGLLSLQGVAGLCTRSGGSRGPGRRQWGPRYPIHARRNLPGKAFGYLKRVRVTPGLQRRFAGLYPGFTDRQWPGLTPRTNPFGLAGSYVFVKQSGPPSHCDLRLQVLPRTAGTPSCERTGPICRVPWPGLAPRRLGLLTQGHLCRFSVRARGILPSPLFMGPGGRRNPHTRAIPPFSPFSPLRHSRAFG